MATNRPKNSKRPCNGTPLNKTAEQQLKRLKKGLTPRARYKSFNLPEVKKSKGHDEDVYLEESQ
eukprot:7202163-Karenia_brevis.AAC.1